jgi:hypothetical protein
VTGRRGRIVKQLLDDLKENERGSTRSHSLENSLSKRLWTCRKAEYRMRMADTIFLISLPPCSECCILSFGWFPDVWILCADVSEHSVPSS